MISNEKYQKLGVFKKTHAKILLITQKNGMRISDYVEHFVDREFRKAGFTEVDLERVKNNKVVTQACEDK
jgi:hypothetical protein